MKKNILGAALVLVLAGCGGGDGGSSPPTGGGTPTPTPTTSPTPSPTPTPTYQTFAQLTGTQTFGTVCGGNYNGPQRLTVGGEPLGDRFATIVSDRSQPSYQISSPGNGSFPAFSTTFTQADRDTTVSSESYRKTASTGFTERFTIFALTSGGAELPYVRVSSAAVQAIQGFYSFTCVYGVPSIVTDRPSSTASYTGLATFGSADITRSGPTGPVTESYRINASTVTMTANPANGQITLSLDLKGQLITGGTVSPTITDLGVFTASETADGASPSFAGILLNSANTVSGTVGGGFFGPQGGTAGISVSIRTQRLDASELTLGGMFVLRAQ